MSTEHEQVLERNELATSVQNLWDQAKAGKILSPRAWGVTIAVVVILGLWWYLATSSKSAASTLWTKYDQISSKSELEEFANKNASTTSGKIARIQLARIKLTSEGLAKLNRRDSEERGKAIKSIEEGRDEFVKLADELKNDPTLRAQCLDMAAKGELALVGVPKAKDSTEFKGSVELAVAHLKTLADTVGKETTAGKNALEQAAELEKNREQVINLGKELQTLLTPPELKVPDIKLPDGLGAPSIPPATNPNMVLPGNVTPATVPPPTTPGTVPPPSTPPATPPTTPPATPPATPPGAAAAGGAASATTPATKK